MKHKSRAWLLVLLALLLASMWYTASRRPVPVNVHYELPASARAGLRCLHLIWTQDGDLKLEARLYTPPFKAPIVHTQAIELPPGDYIINARFEYADGQHRLATASATISRDAAELHMTLVTEPAPSSESN